MAKEGSSGGNGGHRRRSGDRPSTRGRPTGPVSSRLTWWDHLWPIGPCPDVETFAALFEKKLTGRHYERVVRHIRRCRRCGADFNAIGETLIEIIRQGEAEEAASTAPRFEWVDSKRLRSLVPGIESSESQAPLKSMLEVPPPEGVGQAPRVPSQHGKPTLIVLGFAVAVGALFSSHLTPREPAPRLGIARTQRLVSPRFTGSEPWAPLVKKWPHLWREQLLEPAAVGAVTAVEHRRGAGDGFDVGALASAGVTYARGGRADSAVEALRRAVAAEPDSPELLSDLGAALLARAEIGERRRQQEPGAELEDYDADLPAALEAIDHALEIAPGTPEALFNRALALERLYLRRSALDAWQAYLNVDDRTSWAREARQRMEAIVIPVRPDPRRIRTEIAAAANSGDRERLSQLVDSQRHFARATVPEDVLPAWAEAWLEGDRIQAESQLAAARLIADEWEAQTTDETLRDAVGEVESATGEARGQLAGGYRALGQASRALADFELDAAQVGANEAIRALPHRSPAITWATLIRVACVGHRGGDVDEQAAAIIRDSPTDLASVGRAYWIAGVIHARRGHLGTALVEYQLALAAYERLDEVESAVALHQLISEAYGLMGADSACWKHRRIALERAGTIVDRDRAMSMLSISASLALNRRSPRVAAEFLTEALSEPDLESAREIAWAYIWRARVLRDLRRPDDARRDLHRAGAWLMRAKPVERQDLIPDLDFALGLTASDPDQAVRRLSRAFDGFRSKGVAVRLPAVLLARARAHLQADDSVAADGDLRQGIAIMNAQAADEYGQLSAFPTNVADELFQERISLALTEGRIDDAFAMAEMTRTRRFRQVAAQQGVPAPPQPAAVAARLDGDTTLLVFSWLPDALRVWRVERGGISLNRCEWTPAEVASRMATFGADLEAGAWTAETRERAVELYAALVGPAKLANSRLVVVPDEALHTLPFGALINPASGRFLIEERELTIAPSVSAFLKGRARFAAHSGGPRDALIVGDPRTDPRMFPSIRSLAGARLEARAVASLYPRRELLMGDAATRTAFMAALGRRSVVHFAGHAVPNRVAPERSSLPLAEEPGSAGLLVAADIARLDLTGTYTVVLSGCETGVGTDGGGDSPLSLAHAFLAAGVPDVVASLWPIADVPSAPLMTAFHRGLRNGESPAKALRAAQLSMLHSRDTAQRAPGVWAAFQAFGG